MRTAVTVSLCILSMAAGIILTLLLTTPSTPSPGIYSAQALEIALPTATPVPAPIVPVATAIPTQVPVAPAATATADLSLVAASSEKVFALPTLGALPTLPWTVAEPVVAQPVAIQPAAAQPIAVQSDMALPFEEICGNNATLTDLQQQDIAASMAGKRVAGWVGRVYDVEPDGSAYKVQVDMRDGIFGSSQIEILGVNREVAAGLRVDQVITFDGIIQSVNTFMEDICNPIYIVGATIR